jgi:hypothetical protein
MKSILLIGLSGRQRDVAEAVCNQYARKTLLELNGAEPDLIVADVSNDIDLGSFNKPIVKIAKQGSKNQAQAYYSDNNELKEKLTEQLKAFGVK